MAEEKNYQDAPEPPKRTDKPWGYELLYAHTDKYVGKVIHINKGGKLSLQYHNQKDETIYVMNGAMDYEYAGDDGKLKTVRMNAGMSYHTVPGQTHRMIAIEDTDVLEVSTPQLGDVVRLEDAYGRAGTSAP
jgi:quercetin dioxygenase-like cupin family protein